MVVAVINAETGIVENLIVASVNDPCPDGYFFVENYPNNVVIGQSTYSDGKFVTPRPQYTNPVPEQHEANGLEFL